MAKILITESVHPIGPELLTAAGHTVVYADRDMDIIRREIVDADAVLVRIIELPGSLLATAKNLKIVSKHGVGYDNIDLDYCKSHGIAVTITPNANSLSVAEHAFTLMLTLAKNIIPVSNEYRTVGFAAKNHAPGIEMTGKTLGLIGMGRIGKHILHMCRDGLDMHVIVYDPYISEVPEGVEITDVAGDTADRAQFKFTESEHASDRFIPVFDTDKNADELFDYEAKWKANSGWTESDPVKYNGKTWRSAYFTHSGGVTTEYFTDVDGGSVYVRIDNVEEHKDAVETMMKSLEFADDIAEAKTEAMDVKLDDIEIKR